MKLREQFNNVEICIESQLLNLKHDENMKCIDECVEITDEFAIGFAEWWLDKFTFKDFVHKESKELLEIYKKQKQL